MMSLCKRASHFMRLCLRAALTSFVPAGRAIISSVGAEVDRIESDIQRLNPGDHPRALLPTTALRWTLCARSWPAH